MATSVFDGLSDDEVQSLMRACETRSHAAGEAVFHEGDAGDDVFVVLSGRIRIAKALSLSTDKTLELVDRGGVFGELALLGGGQRSASASAMEAAEVLVLTRDGFLGLAERDPALGFKIMGRLAAILAQRLQTTTDLLRDTVRWSLEISGAAELDLQHLIHAHPNVEVRLAGGETFHGRLLKAEPTAHGELLLTFADVHDDLRLVPFHALTSLRLAKATALVAAEEQ